MKTLTVTASQIYDQPAEKLYAVISDYRTGLPSILPKTYFTGWEIERGGHGAGTIVNVTMNFFGKSFSFRLEVTEPDPGRVLVETDTDTGKYTRFTFTPTGRNAQTKLTIDSAIPGKPGLFGPLQALNVAFFAKRIYKTELKNLAERKM